MSGLIEARPRRRWAITVVVALFVAVDIVLVVFALSQARTPPDTGEIYVIPTPLPVSSSSAGPTSAPVVTDPVEEVGLAIAPHRFIVAADASTAWRGRIGACPASTLTVDHTTNGGSNWIATQVTADVDVSAVVQVQGAGASSIAFVAQNGSDCALLYTASADAGDSWTATTDDSLSTSWFVQPTDPSVVNTPVGARAAPCVVIALAPKSADQAAVLCREQVVFRTDDSGESWDGGIEIAGAANLASDPDGYVIAAAGQGACSGVEIRTLGVASESDDGGFTGCFQARYGEGEVAIASGEGAIWVWAGTSLGVSEDKGATWK